MSDSGLVDSDSHAISATGIDEWPTTQEEMLGLVNAIRQSGHYTTRTGRYFQFEPLPSYAYSQEMADRAQFHANRHILGHDGFGWRDNGLEVDWETWCEIVAVADSASRAIDAFMNSDAGHRDAILWPAYYHAGAGYSSKPGEPVGYFVMWFGRRRDDVQPNEPDPDYLQHLPIVRA